MIWRAAGAVSLGGRGGGELGIIGHRKNGAIGHSQMRNILGTFAGHRPDSPADRNGPESTELVENSNISLAGAWISSRTNLKIYRQGAAALSGPFRFRRQATAKLT